MSAQTFRISSSVERAMAGLPRSEPIPAWSFVQALSRVHPDYAGGVAGRLAEDKGPAPGARHRVDEWLQRIRDLYDPTRAEVLDTRLTILGLARLESSVSEYLASVGALGALEAEVEKESGMALGNLLVDRNSDPDGGTRRSIHEQRTLSDRGGGGRSRAVRADQYPTAGAEQCYQNRVAETALWSGPDQAAVAVARVPKWSWFKQFAPRDGNRIPVQYFGNRRVQAAAVCVDADPRDCTGIYNKSLLYLVSNAFEREPRIPGFRDGVPILGMERHIRRDAALDDLTDSGGADLVIAPNTQPVGSPHASQSKHHGAFDDDDATVRATFMRIVHGSGATAATATGAPGLGTGTTRLEFERSKSSLRDRRLSLDRQTQPVLHHTPGLHT